ncbi:MAG: hypothetical protein R2771_14280 [Saprospiraceae bacterium]
MLIQFLRMKLFYDEGVGFSQIWDEGYYFIYEIIEPSTVFGGMCTNENEDRLYLAYSYGYSYSSSKIISIDFEGNNELDVHFSSGSNQEWRGLAINLDEDYALLGETIAIWHN